MAELRISLDTQSAAASARDLQRILNDIKMAARDLDNMSLGTLGGTISRVADSMRTMQSAVSSTAPTVASIVTAVSGLSQALEGGIRSQQAWVAQWQAFNGTGNYARDVLGQLSQAMAQLHMTAASTRSDFAQSGQQLQLFTTSATAAQQALQALITTARSIQNTPLLSPQVTQTSQQAAAQIQGQVQAGTAFPPTYGRSATQAAATDMNDYTRYILNEQVKKAEEDRLAVEAIMRRRAAGTSPAAQQTFLAPGTMYGQPQMPAGPGFADPTSQGVTGIAISNQRVYQTLATSAQQATQAVTPLGQAMAQTKEKKDALDKNVEKMSSGSGSLWQMTFALRTLTGVIGALSFRALYEDAKSLAETLVDTGMQLERATALFDLMGNTTMSSAQEIEFATKTAQEFGLAILPAIEGLGKMQASAYGTAYAGETVNGAFKGMMAGLAAVAADSRTTTSAMSALSDMIGRVEISGRGIRQLSRDFPGLRERLVAPMGAQDVEHLMLILDRGNFTVSQFLKAMQEAFSGMLLDKARENVSSLTGAVTGFYNALLKLGEAMLNAGFKRDFITGIQDLTAVLTSPGFLDGAKQFAEIFGVVVKGALEAVAATLAYVRDHLALVGGVIAGLVSAGGMVTFASTVLTLARAFQILGVSMIGAAGPIGIIAALVGVGAAYWIAHSKATMDAQKATDDLAKSTTGLVIANRDVATSVPTEHMVRYAKDEKAINDEIEKLRLTTVGYRDELGLLESGIQKDSVAFTGLATALKFYNEQVAHGNVAFDQAAVQRLKDYAVAAQAAAAGIAKIAENRNQLRNIREESDITQRLTTMAAGGASEGALTIERNFQEQFRTMRAHFEDLIYNERDSAVRNKLVDQFKQQANALREASVQAQLYANRLKAIQDQTKGEQDFQMEEDLLSIWKSIDDSAYRYTKEATRSTASTIASYVPPTIAPESQSINAFMYQLDRANIGAQRQQLNGPVEMTITGNVTVNGMGGRAGGGGVGTAATGAYADLVNQYSEAAGIRPVVAQAVLNVESRGRAGATSSKGAGGLMQLMPGTAAELRVGNVYDPAQNIEGGTRYLSQLARQFGDDLVKTIAAYNAGPGAVKAAGGVPNYPETQKYVTDVLREIQQMEQRKPAGAGTGTPVMEQGIFGGSFSTVRDAIRAIFGSVPTRKDLEADVNASPSLNLEGRYQNTANEIFNKIVDELTKAEPSPEVLEKLHARLDALLAPQAQGVGANLSAVFPETAMMLRQARENAKGAQPAQIAVDITKTSPVLQEYGPGRAEFAIEEARRRQQTLGSLYAEQQGLQPTALGRESFQPGQMTLATMSRTRIEAQRDQAARRALQEYNQNVQLTPDDIIQNTEAYQRVQQQRQQVEFGARRGVDRQVIQSQKDYNITLAEQNESLKIAQGYLSTEAKYRDIDTRAAEEEAKAIRDSVDPELRVRTLALIEANKELAHSWADMNGPIQQYIDSIGTIKDRTETLFVGVLRSVGDAIATFASTGKVDIKSFADAFIADVVRMAYELAIVKPLLMAIQGQGTFGENFIAGLGGTPESAYGSELAGMTTSAETLSGLEESIAAIGGGASTGGYVTLRGIEHFQGGGMVGRGRDSVPAMLSPGEMILNQAQQRSVAASMQGGGITYVFNPTIHAQDAESVRKTLPQIQAEFYRATERMVRRNNIRVNT